MKKVVPHEKLIDNLLCELYHEIIPKLVDK